MKKHTLITYLLLLTFGLSAQNNKFEEANKLFEEKEYAEAINLYESILNSGEESAALYYNLGNAYFRIGEKARAILNYERSLLLEPNNEDAKFNLEFTRTQIVDQIDALDTFFLKSWINDLSEWMSSNSWAMLSIAAFLMFIAISFLYVFGKSRSVKKAAFSVGVLLFCISLSSFFLAKYQKDKYVNNQYAIILDSTLTVKGSPDESGTDLFPLHEGTKVRIKSIFGSKEWVEIQLEDGNTGWVKAHSIEKI